MCRVLYLRESQPYVQQWIFYNVKNKGVFFYANQKMSLCSNMLTALTTGYKNKSWFLEDWWFKSWPQLMHVEQTYKVSTAPRGPAPVLLRGHVKVWYEAYNVKLAKKLKCNENKIEKCVCFFLMIRNKYLDRVKEKWKMKILLLLTVTLSVTDLNIWFLSPQLRNFYFP